MRSRRRPFVAALAGLAGMLFLQAAIAFAPCGLPNRAAATAMAAAMASMPDCQEGGTASLGVAHCTLEDQAVVAAEVQLPELAALPAAEPLRAAPPPVHAAVVVPPRPAAAGPPPRIRFQSFLL
jgi:hypothetical protein